MALNEGRAGRVIAGLAAVAAIAATVSLGNWQLRRAAEKVRMQAVRDNAARLPEIEFVPGDDPAMLVGRRLRVRGRIDEAHTVFLDNRIRNGVAGFDVISPIRVEGTDRVVMVLRGWIASDPAHRNRVPTLHDAGGPLTFEGVVEAGLPAGLQLGDWHAGGPQERIWPRYDAATFASWSGLRPYRWIVRQDADNGDGLVRDWAQPGFGADRHRAYALQWYTMAAVFAAMWAWYGWWLPRRRAGTDERPDSER